MYISDLKDTARSSVSSDVKSVHMKQWDSFQQHVACGQQELSESATGDAAVRTMTFQSRTFVFFSSVT